MVGRLGLEPRTCGLRVRCAANCASGPWTERLAVMSGLSPMRRSTPAGIGSVALDGYSDLDGPWRSLVARVLWEHEVVGSSPTGPTAYNGTRLRV